MKRVFFITVYCLIFSLYADVDGQQPVLEQEVFLEQLNVVSDDEQTTSQPQQERKVDSSQTRFYQNNEMESKCVRNIHPVQMDFSFLYWTVYETNLEYAISPTITGAAGSGEHSIQGALGNYKAADFDWKPGCRVKLGYVNHDDLEVLGQYIFYYSKGFNSVDGPTSGTTALNSAFDTTTANRVIKLTSKINLHYHVPDLLVAKRGSLFSNGCTILGIFGGLKGAFIKQSWVTKQYALVATDIETTKTDWKYSGGGVTVGADLQQQLGAGFQFLANLQGSSLLGRWKQSQTETVTIFEDPMESYTMKKTKFVETFQYALGFGWMYDTKNIGIRLSALYEAQTWFNLHDIIIPFESSFFGGKVTTIRNNNTTLHGLTASLGIYF